MKKWRVNLKVVEGSVRVVLVQSTTAYGRVEFSSTQFSLAPLSSGALAKLRNEAISFAMSVSTSVRMEKLGSHWRDFHEI
jgi:hypothetical protein